MEKAGEENGSWEHREDRLELNVVPGYGVSLKIITTETFLYSVIEREESQQQNQMWA